MTGKMASSTFKGLYHFGVSLVDGWLNCKFVSLSYT